MALQLQRLPFRLSAWFNRSGFSSLATKPTNAKPPEKQKDDIQIALSSDESMYVVWHPEKDFPYECTKPLPEAKVEESASVLKTQLTPELLQVFKKKTPEQARQELMSITHTTKHRWFPRSRDKKAKKTPMDRQYL